MSKDNEKTHKVARRLNNKNSRSWERPCKTVNGRLEGC